MIEAEKTIIKGCIDEMVDSMTRVAAERDLQKEIVARIKEETTVKPRVFRKMAKTAFAANFSEEQALHEEFEELYTELLSAE